jgi:DNA-binding CsgD family transcriptional regulator
MGNTEVTPIRKRPPTYELVDRTTAAASPARASRRSGRTTFPRQVGSGPSRAQKPPEQSSLQDPVAGESSIESVWHEAHRLVDDAILHGERSVPAPLSAIEAIVALCLDDLSCGDWEESLHLTEEGLGLCETYGYSELEWPLWLARGFIRAAQGEHEEAMELSRDLERWGRSRRARAVELYGRYVRCLASLGRGDYEQAFRAVSELTAERTFSNHVLLALWASVDLVECALRTDRRRGAESYVAMIQRSGSASLSARGELVFGCATALVSGDAAGMFDRALSVPGIERWPFDVARVELAYGEHLRRGRSINGARLHLAAAAERFARLGAQPWLSRAETELRATGAAALGDDGSPPRMLTPQEMEIAQLAASGLTNKEIGARVYLSHRTVATHLYRVFPKLGITSRAALRDALSAACDEVRAQLSPHASSLGSSDDESPAHEC